ncbi:hypothetical protein SHJG_0794 [Streptomyces hygroscopicus subsp. jinggangensis 5008]|nr:hypothetical protein SHJG_0794 [Streptomyces hygroscopicus subsp. jinggangensis 5008]AGF60293.1 hypothetical protein SHJGH_0627 [Streptomyces hygroscopicus subsp. jinggangensis TL01]
MGNSGHVSPCRNGMGIWGCAAGAAFRGLAVRFGSGHALTPEQHAEWGVETLWCVS